jgi:hypothetical protein
VQPGRTLLPSSSFGSKRHSGPRGRMDSNRASTPATTTPECTLLDIRQPNRGLLPHVVEFLAMLATKQPSRDAELRGVVGSLG